MTAILVIVIVVLSTIIGLLVVYLARKRMVANNSPKESNERKICNRVIKVSPTEYSCYKDSKPESLCFKGVKYPVVTWKEVLLLLCSLVAKENPDCFDGVIEGIVGRKRERKYFSKDEKRFEEHQKPRKVEDTGIYIVTNLSADETACLCDAIYKHFGYGENFVENMVKYSYKS